MNKNEHCWQFMDCQLSIRKQCLVYNMDTEGECWIINQVGKKKDKSHILNACKQCPWFLNQNVSLTNKEEIQKINAP